MNLACTFVSLILPTFQVLSENARAQSLAMLALF